MLDRDDALALARRVVEKSAADETEVTVESTQDSFVRFARAGATQNADRLRYDVSIRVRRKAGAGYREARATCGSIDDAALTKALDAAQRLVGVSPENPEALALDGAVDVPATSLDRTTLDHGFDAKAEWVRRAVEGCRAHSLAPAGLIETQGVSRAICNSSGRAVHGYSCRAGFSLTASGENGAGFGESIAKRVEDVRPDAVVERAIEKARRNAQPMAIDPGAYTVVLEPSAVSSILLFASYYGFGAREVDEKASFLCGRMGEKVFADGVTIMDDAANDVYPGIPFDGEGNPRTKVTLIDHGKVIGPVTDRVYAKKLGVACTGHAPAQPSTDGPRAEHLVMGAGEQSLEELIGGVEKGLLITQFHYTNMIEPRELTLTGMTRNGTFLIENGKLMGGVKNLRFTETLVNALSRVSGISREREVVGALFDGEMVTPALRIEDFRFTSATDF